MTHQNYTPGRRLSRRPSFILVDKEEEDEISCFSVLGNMGIPILYILAGATSLIGIICMGLLTKFYSDLSPPTCLLYSDTTSSLVTYQFGSSLSICYWVAYGGILSLLICCVCGFFYIFHVKDDKDVTFITYGCVIAMFIASILFLAIACTLAQGLRITCTNITLNPGNNKGKSCKEQLDQRVEGFNLPIQPSSMITAAMANYWIATFSYILITIFHIALIVRRTGGY